MTAFVTEEPQLVGAAVTRYCHDHGVLTLSAGTFGNVLRFLPPLSLTDDLLDEAVGVLADAFATL